MILAEAILADYLHKLRNQFYDDDKQFYQQRALLVKAITLLASWLDKRAAKLPDRRYREILDEIIRTIQHHGDLAKVGYFCRYFLKAVQTHIDHHGDAYYEEAKSFRYALDNLTGQLTAKQARKVAEAKDDTVEHLARLAKLVKGGRPKGAKPKKEPDQPSLF